MTLAPNCDRAAHVIIENVHAVYSMYSMFSAHRLKEQPIIARLLKAVYLQIGRVSTNAIVKAANADLPA
ncbi:hypothetical protein FV222_10185 [Methylobacterium sp. WL103]|uniref:hypothetical protein n=1 Tax=Methylobacterium sp. WL103 TaxID=2603891 RepID=UPI0011C706F5|nr:hypothetical protein [Methylobacterium sp. WL103]TXN01843.1 hypothetical protein FV222_10185 [Methylobacterium sp. WL103]